MRFVEYDYRTGSLVYEHKGDKYLVPARRIRGPKEVEA